LVVFAKKALDRRICKKIKIKKIICSDFKNISIFAFTAASLLAAMDHTADPCQDFFQFACGTWNKKHVIPGMTILIFFSLHKIRKSFFSLY
jgi:hypothetical protein